MPLWTWPYVVVGGMIFFLIVEAEKLVLRMFAVGRGR